jgi:hypothetical protein
MRVWADDEGLSEDCFAAGEKPLSIGVVGVQKISVFQNELRILVVDIDAFCSPFLFDSVTFFRLLPLAPLFGKLGVSFRRIRWKCTSLDLPLKELDAEAFSE